MISNSSLTREYLEAKRVELSCDQILLEKSIKAIQLLELLIVNGVDLTFKGGTSLILLLDRIQRLSIDIDIIVEPEADFSSALDKVISTGKFFRYEEDIRKTVFPVRHYKFYYDSINPSQKNAYILLDVLYERSMHTELISTPIRSSIFQTEDPVTNVRTPSIDAIIGDKLTAFAPNTTGIPYGSQKGMEICKQLFDIATLFNYQKDTGTVRGTFQKIALTEARYRGMNSLTTEDVLKDTFHTALIIGARGKIEPEHYRELDSGRSKLSSHILGFNYNQTKFFSDAAKVAYLSACLLKKSEASFRWSEEELFGRITDDSFVFLNKLSKVSPEAYAYFGKAVDLIGKQVF
ncbi:nucleotidyl transferase AbiEii/AbiGii toxin family protein [uncultured Mesotoga sp.]|uniref:nucleotidyl transferase AbiEii/AbiGii toxin family protein n=1 Tax=uncultured Mesotoga sp. TaxID=1184400 RepID=UPI002597E148|nr:nucleotidyl transferase AbiEii/AbiGii toxin family protein [uncultured Mesotoga sp.]